MAFEYDTDRVLERVRLCAIAEAIRLMEDSQIEDGLAVLKSHVCSHRLISRPPSPLIYEISQCVRNMLSSRNYEAAASLLELLVNVGESLPLQDIFILAAHGKSSVASRALRNSKLHIEDRYVAIAYVLANAGTLDRFITIWRNEIWESFQCHDANTKDKLKDCFLAVTWLRSRLQGNPLEVPAGITSGLQSLLTEFHNGLQGAVQLKSVSKTAERLSEKAVSPISSVLAREIDLWSLTIDSILNSSVDETLLLDHLDRLKHRFNRNELSKADIRATMLAKTVMADRRHDLELALAAVVEGHYAEARNYAETTASSSGLISDLAYYMLTVGECSRERPALSVADVDRKGAESLRVPGAIDIARILALQQALTLRLIRAGEIERARAELSILKTYVEAGTYDLAQSIRFFSEAIAISSASRKGRSLPQTRFIGRCSGRGLYSQLLSDLYKSDDNDETDVVSRFFPALSIIRELHCLREQDHINEYVKYAGEKCDELIKNGFTDNEFIFAIRLEQATSLERLGRYGHAQRVARYVLDRSLKLKLSDRLVSRARTLLTRMMIAHGHAGDAVELLEATLSTEGLSQPEVYVLSLAYEAEGCTELALETLQGFQQLEISDDTYDLFYMCHSSVVQRIDTLRQCKSTSPLGEGLQVR